MNPLCSGCGKPPHAGGCRLPSSPPPPPSAEDLQRRRSYLESDEFKRERDASFAGLNPNPTAKTYDGATTSLRKDLERQNALADGLAKSATKAWDKVEKAMTLLREKDETLAAARREVEAAYRALKMVDDAYWGEFCGYCGVILSLDSQQNDECGPQHTAVHLAHEWVEVRAALADPGDGEEGTR